MKSKRIIRTAAVLGAIAVGMGALGAHALKTLLTSDQLNSYLTGVRYHFWHVLVILLLVALKSRFTPQAYTWATRLFFAGIILFSGSIYLLSLQGILGWNMGTILGPITPIGGLLLISGWLVSAAGVTIKT